ncbi:hypothetical protein IWW57_002669, partial [Coemansia sp. S610]
MACMRASHMTGHILGQIFYLVTGYDFTPICIATGGGVTAKTLDEVCGLVKEWLQDFLKTIVEGNQNAML